MRRVASWCALLLVVSLSAVLPGRVDAASAAAPTFHPTACPKGAFPDRLDVDCGYVVVPENRTKPNSRQIHVAAAVVHATNQEPGAEPILLLPGGAGASSMTRFSIRAYLSGTTWNDAHDVVLVDTRGVGQSSPRLGCPELDQAQVEAFYAGRYVGSRSAEVTRHALRACRARLTAEGVGVENYVVDEAVADLEVLRRALTVDQWNLLAISADGIIGMSYVRAHPESIRATIVDSGMSVQMAGPVDYDRGNTANLEAVFAGCSANAACRQKYPHLRRLFLAKVRELQRRPFIVRLPHYRPHPVTLRIDGVFLYSDAIYGLWPGNLFVPGGDIPFTLDYMWRIAHSADGAIYRELFGHGPETAGPRSRYIADGRNMSLECHDMLPSVTPAVLEQAAKDIPAYAPRYRDADFDLGFTMGNYRSPAGCRVWGVQAGPAAQRRPVASDVPTLVLGGGFDQGVTTNIVQQNLVGLTHGTYVEFPASGHLQLAFFNVAHHCARDLARAFLDAPKDELDTSCAGDLPEYDFTPPEDPPQRPLGRRGTFSSDRWSL